MNRVVSILMRRDGVTQKEAEEMIDNCRAELLDSLDGTSCVEPDEVIANELGLEPDYIGDIIYG